MQPPKNPQAKLAAHKRKLGVVLYSGVAGGHHGNPAASLRVEKVYGLPVLMSCLGAFVQNKSEKDIINQHYKSTLDNLMRHYQGTRASLSGSLSGYAFLHFRHRHENCALWFLKLLQLRQRDFRFPMNYSRWFLKRACLDCEYLHLHSLYLRVSSDGDIDDN